VTFNRLNFLQHTVKSIYERTKYPHRLWVVDNNSTDGTRQWLKGAKTNGFLHDYILMDKNVGLAGAFSKGFEKVESDFFITTQDDIIPPDLTPCWLERMLHLAEKNTEYGGISMRIERIRHREVNEFKELIESPTSLASVLRVQKKNDIAEIGGFGKRPHWESTSFVARMKKLKKKFAAATHLYASHTSFMTDNKGFEDGYTTYHTYSKERVTQGADQPYPDIDPKTNIPLKINTSRDRHEQEKREEYYEYWGVDKRRNHKMTKDQKKISKYAAEGHGIEIGSGRIKSNENAIGVDIFPYSATDVLAEASDLWMFKDGEMDFVIASHALEHFPDTKAVMKEWKRVLKVGGTMAVAVPDAESCPGVVRDPHKCGLTKEILRIIFKYDLGMKVIESIDIPDMPRGKKSILVAAIKLK